MSAPLRAATLTTPALRLSVVSTATAFGGFSHSLVPLGTMWGDFRPELPAEVSREGEVFVRQTAVFVCRSADGLVRGSVLRIGGHDWVIVAFDVDALGAVRVQLERIH